MESLLCCAVLSACFQSCSPVRLSTYLFWLRFQQPRLIMKRKAAPSIVYFYYIYLVSTLLSSQQVSILIFILVTNVFLQSFLSLCVYV